MIDRVSVWPAVLGLALAMIVVTLIEPVPSSLAYASGLLVLISLLGWSMEAREVAGPPPEVEPEHEEEEEAPGPSYWPVVLSLGIVGIAAGLIYDFDYGALVIALPLAAAAGGAWSNQIKQEMAAEEARSQAIGIVGPEGNIVMPVPTQALTAQA